MNSNLTHLNGLPGLRGRVDASPVGTDQELVLGRHLVPLFESLNESHHRSLGLFSEGRITDIWPGDAQLCIYVSVPAHSLMVVDLVRNKKTGDSFRQR